MRYLPKDEVYTTEAEAARFLQGYLERSKHTPFARWAAVRKVDGIAVGWCGLKEEDNGEVDLGYRLLSAYWGGGYATEASVEWLRYGFGPASLERIVARTAEGNGASESVLRKLGFARLPAGDHQADGYQWRKFLLEREGWKGLPLDKSC
jgi:ribosomal-protein-alanine N-acetyltransferase